MSANPAWNELKVTKKALWSGEWYISDGEKILGPYSDKEIFVTMTWQDSFKDSAGLQICQKGYSKWYKFSEMDYLYKFALTPDEESQILKNQLEEEKKRLAARQEMLQQKTSTKKPEVEGKSVGPKTPIQDISWDKSLQSFMEVESKIAIEGSVKAPKKGRKNKHKKKSPKPISLKQFDSQAKNSVPSEKTDSVEKIKISKAERILANFGKLRLGRSKPLWKILASYIFSFGIYGAKWYAFTVFQMGRHLDGSYWQVSKNVQWMFCVPVLAMIPGRKLLKLYDACHQKKHKKLWMTLAFIIPIVGMLAYQKALNQYWESQLIKHE